jgi:hypothetical protein
MSIIFPKIDFESEFWNAEEALKAVHRLEVFCGVGTEHEVPLLSLTYQCPDAAQNWEQCARLSGTEDPFYASTGLVALIALIAGMASEGIEVADLHRPNGWFEVKYWCAAKAKLTAFPNMLFRDPASGLARVTRRALARRRVQYAKDLGLPHLDPGALIAPRLLHILSSLAADNHGADQRPFADLDHAVEAEALTGVQQYEGLVDNGLDEEALRRASSLIASQWADDEVDFEIWMGSYLLEFIPLFITTWLDRGVPGSALVNGAKIRSAIMLSEAGCTAAESQLILDIVMANALLAWPQLFGAHVEDAHCALGALSTFVVQSNSQRVAEVCRGVMCDWASTKDMADLGFYLREVGIDLMSPQAMDRVGYQMLSWSAFSAQGCKITDVEDAYYSRIDGFRVPAWVHSGDYFISGLSAGFLAEIIFRVSAHPERLIRIGGWGVSKTVMLDSLAELDDDVFLPLVFALDSAGALTQELIYSLELSAEFLGPLNLAALSRRSRGFLLESAMGV